MRIVKIVPLLLLSLAACGDAEPCTVSTGEDGQSKITCPDGSELVLEAAVGENGEKGQPGQAGNEGVAGVDGEAAKNSFVLTEDEPAGENCAAGGEKLTVFLDLNDNGKLDPGEERQVEYLCQP